jgi:hypothetical protein
MTESEMIGVAGDLTGTPRGKQHFDGPAVFAAEIVQVGDVVVGLIAQQRHAVALARFAGFLITLERAGKVIQADQAHRHVAKDDGDALGVFVRQQASVSALVVSDGFLETILAVKDVAEVDFKPRETPRVVETGEDFLGAVCRFEGFIVLTQQDERLDGTAQSARGLFLDLRRIVQFDGLFVMFDRRGVISAGVERISLGAQTQSQTFVAAQPLPD